MELPKPSSSHRFFPGKSKTNATSVSALGRVGAAAALKIPHAREKLGRGVLGKVVRQPLPDQPHPEAAAHDQMPVVRDGLQMSPEFVHSCRLLFSYLIIR